MTEQTTKGKTCPMCGGTGESISSTDSEPFKRGNCSVCDGQKKIYTVSDVRELEEAILSENYRTETKTVVNYSHIESEFDKMLPTEKEE